MRIYFAGAESLSSNSYKGLLNYIKYPLLSYYYINRIFNNMPQHWEKENIFIDSGAYSAFSKGGIINHQEYIKFIIENEFKVYAGLDVIGDAEASKHNFNYELKAGLKSIPAFHYGEPFDYLRYYLDKTDYIALGGVAQLRGKKNILNKWFDSCFNLINPYKTKIHGFAVTSLSLLQDYPFYSVDSSTWSACIRFGRIPKRYYKGAYTLKNFEKETLPKEGLFLVQQRYPRIKDSLLKQLDLQNYITELWTKRGIVWE